jgi:hypothetical protein
MVLSLIIQGLLSEWVQKIEMNLWKLALANPIYLKSRIIILVRLCKGISLKWKNKKEFIKLEN